jgi:hypothetical protein
MMRKSPASSSLARHPGCGSALQEQCRRYTTTPHTHSYCRYVVSWLPLRLQLLAALTQLCTDMSGNACLDVSMRKYSGLNKFIAANLLMPNWQLSLQLRPRHA